jgi:clan AA aspartic protease (TIGR02281 family)
MGHRVISSLLALCLLFSSAAAADERVPDAATVLAKVLKNDPVPKEFRRTTVTSVSNGAVRTVRHIKRDADWREMSVFGPFHSESGVVKGQGWHQNDNGQTVFDEPDPGMAAPDPVTTTVTHVRTPVDAYVVAELNVRGWGTRRYVDPQTWHVVRFERITANGTIATTYDDERQDGGRVFAHHWSTVNGYAKTTSDTRVTAYDEAAVSEAEVAVPNSRRLLVEFPPGVMTTKLPAQFVHGRVYVRMMVKGRGLDFVLDTGAAGITIDTTVAQQLGLTQYAAQSAVTAGRYGTARTIVPEMTIGNLSMHDVAVQIVPDGVLEGSSIKIVGLLGFDFLAELGITIDYEHEQVTAVPEPAYTPPTGPNVIALDVRIGDGSPYLNVTINGALSERFLLDTGGGGSLLIFDAFARKHPEALKDKGGGGDARRMRFAGIGGAIETQAYQLGSGRYGTVNFVDFVGYLVTAKHSYAGNSDGLIGTEFLRYFTLGLDYANSRVYLVPNDVGRRAITH